jgi:hypothetical protein
MVEETYLHLGSIWHLFEHQKIPSLAKKGSGQSLTEGLGLCPLPQGHSIFMRWWAATHLFTEVVEEAWPPPPHPLFFERAEEM